MRKSMVAVFLCLFVAHLPGFLLAAPQGVIVEEVTKGASGEKSGLQVGDLLLSWERLASPPANPEAARGTFNSLSDWLFVEREQGPRGIMKLTGQRAGKAMVFEVPLGPWDVEVRPQMPEKALLAYQEGKTLIAAKEIDKGILRWQETAAALNPARDGMALFWIHTQIGAQWTKARQWDKARPAYQSALKLAGTKGEAILEVITWRAIGSTFHNQNNFDKAEEAYQTAIAISEKAWGESLTLAFCQNDFGLLAFARGNLDAAGKYHQLALRIYEKLAPGSMGEGSCLNNLGRVAQSLSRFDAAESYYQRSLAIEEKLRPGGLGVAMTHNNLGVVAYNRGDLDSAEKSYRTVLAMFEKIVPDSPYVAVALTNLSNVVRDRGDLASAETYCGRALTIFEKLFPGSLNMAVILNNLGILAAYRGNYEAAESYHKQSLVIREKLSPGTLNVAGSLNNLGGVAELRGELDAAEDFFRRALEIKQKLAPESLEIAWGLNNLGTVVQDRGDLESAQKLFDQALALKEKLAPESLDVATSLSNLGDLALERKDLKTAGAYFQRALEIRKKLALGSVDQAATLGDLGQVALADNDVERAETLYRDALAVYEKMAPGSIDEATCWHALGMISVKKGLLPEGAKSFLRSLEALEAQIRVLGGSQETKAGFRTRYLIYYKDYIDVLLKLKRSEEAFQALERSRGQSFLAMLAERDLVFTADIAPEIEKARKKLEWEYDKVQGQIAGFNPQKDNEKIEELLARLRSLREEQTSLSGEIRKASPKLAALQYPQPLDVSSARAVLDPGTVMLSYSIGGDQNYLFVVAADGFQVFPLSVTERELKDEVDRFQRLIQQGRAITNTGDNLVVQGRKLFETLIQPASRWVEKSQRVLIVPDGPLLTLPFGALTRKAVVRGGASQKRGKDWQYFVEWKPLHTVVSATVYAELKRERAAAPASPSDKIFLAFGDPKYPSAEAAASENPENAAVRSLVKRGFDLIPLPGTRTEVKAIADLYGGREEVYVGEESTEEKAKSLGRGFRYIHFACHGLLDERMPLNSSLALTIPSDLKAGQDNGFLQAWEVFEQMRLSADLVTLSACRTGLGTELGGEGLVGLTRAFQYAGARSVLASLWEVADLTTAEFMKAFYSRLNAGLSKDEALRMAQLELIRNPLTLKDENGRAVKMDASHPFFWASFELVGDWK
jgi:CHAT domain-containing protein/Tfp pilus assembly protein PilF